MDAAFILAAIRAKHPTAAVVPELTTEDYDLPDSGEETLDMFMPKFPAPDGHKTSRRIDALMFESGSRTAFEIKVSKADFNRDTYWKRRAWQALTNRFIYVVPHDLDVMPPHPCGLWKVAEDGRITVAKKATVNHSPEYLPQAVIQRLAYRAAALRAQEGGE